jgi:hypothetical protein
MSSPEHAVVYSIHRFFYFFFSLLLFALQRQVVGSSLEQAFVYALHRQGREELSRTGFGVRLTASGPSGAF